MTHGSVTRATKKPPGVGGRRDWKHGSGSRPYRGHQLRVCIIMEPIVPDSARSHPRGPAWDGSRPRSSGPTAGGTKIKRRRARAPSIMRSSPGYGVVIQSFNT